MYTLQQLVKKGMLALFVAGGMTACKNQGNNTTPPAGAAAPATTTAAASSFKIAYVDLDSLEAHFDYFIQKKKELEQKQEAMDNELNANANALRNEIQQFQAKANTMTQNEGESIQRALYGKQQELEQKRQNLAQKYAAQESQFNDELQKKLDAFLQTYNADKRYAYIFSFRAGASNILYHDQAYDITADVIKGMNTK
ncbi:hypothetical protein DCC81_11455 [Chitinophaga parva]|uniref:Outer membrane chaperone Skp n=1 Tax=Chitinophaga parva TaxID=2169414 RepID=A0A2T7BF72_9BACT|nr:OmpH family outer membrane protein [Chitinophaga parva]PUZ24928.1 hypothetical protein DCC81_11455 [Chitinophaga parva]